MMDKYERRSDYLIDNKDLISSLLKRPDELLPVLYRRHVLSWTEKKEILDCSGEKRSKLLVDIIINKTNSGTLQNSGSAKSSSGGGGNDIVEEFFSAMEFVCPAVLTNLLLKGKYSSGSLHRGHSNSSSGSLRLSQSTPVSSSGALGASPGSALQSSGAGAQLTISGGSGSYNNDMTTSANYANAYDGASTAEAATAAAASYKSRLEEALRERDEATAEAASASENLNRVIQENKELRAQRGRAVASLENLVSSGSGPTPHATNSATGTGHHLANFDREDKMRSAEVLRGSENSTSGGTSGGPGEGASSSVGQASLPLLNGFSDSAVQNSRSLQLLSSVLADSTTSFDTAAAKNESLVWETHEVTLHKVPVFGFGIAVSGGVDNPHFANGDPSIAVSDVLKAGPAEGSLQVNDRILKANENPLDNVDHATAIRILKECGDQVKLVVKRKVVVTQNIELDIPPRKITLKKANKKEDYGLLLVCRYIVQQIKGNSVVAQDGQIKEGDSITKVNNVAVEELSLAEIKKQLESKKEITLYVKSRKPIKKQPPNQSRPDLEQIISRPEVSALRHEDNINIDPGSPVARPTSDATAHTLHMRDASQLSNLSENVASRSKLPNKSKISVEPLTVDIAPLAVDDTGGGGEDLEVLDDSEEAQLVTATPITPVATTTADSDFTFPSPLTNGDVATGETRSADGYLDGLIHQMNSSNVEPDLGMKRAHHFTSPPQAQLAPLPGPEPREVSFYKVGPGNLGLRLVGGNATGIYVAHVQENTQAEEQGLVEGDQILKVNNIDELDSMTREDVCTMLLNLQDRVDMLVQYQRPRYDKMVTKGDYPDRFYVRAHYSHKSSGKGQMTVVANDIYKILDTLFGGKVGFWLAVKVDQDLMETTEKGCVPNLAGAEAIMCNTRDGNIDGGLGGGLGGTNKRPSRSHSKLFRRKSARRAKSLGRDNWDDVIFAQTASKYPAYERVYLGQVGFSRPVVIFGPVSDLAQDWLVRDLPSQFELPDQDLSLSIIKLGAIRHVISKGKHCVLDVTPGAVDRLNYCHFYPIVVFIRPKSKQDIKDIRHKCSAPRLSSKKLYENSQKISDSFSFLFTATLELSSGTGWYTQLVDLISQQQKSDIWLSEHKPDEVLHDEFLFPMASRLSSSSSSLEPEFDSGTSTTRKNKQRTITGDGLQSQRGPDGSRPLSLAAPPTNFLSQPNSPLFQHSQSTIEDDMRSRQQLQRGGLGPGPGIVASLPSSSVSPYQGSLPGGGTNLSLTRTGGGGVPGINNNNNTIDKVPRRRTTYVGRDYRNLGRAFMTPQDETRTGGRGVGGGGRDGSLTDYGEVWERQEIPSGDTRLNQSLEESKANSHAYARPLHLYNNENVPSYATLPRPTRFKRKQQAGPNLINSQASRHYNGMVYPQQNQQMYSSGVPYVGPSNGAESDGGPPAPAAPLFGTPPRPELYNSKSTPPPHSPSALNHYYYNNTAAVANGTPISNGNSSHGNERDGRGHPPLQQQQQQPVPPSSHYHSYNLDLSSEPIAKSLSDQHPDLTYRPKSISDPPAPTGDILKDITIPPTDNSLLINPHPQSQSAPNYTAASPARSPATGSGYGGIATRRRRHNVPPLIIPASAGQSHLQPHTAGPAMYDQHAVMNGGYAAPLSAGAYPLTDNGSTDSYNKYLERPENKHDDSKLQEKFGTLNPSALALTQAVSAQRQQATSKHKEGYEAPGGRNIQGPRHQQHQQQQQSSGTGPGGVPPIMSRSIMNTTPAAIGPGPYQQPHHHQSPYSTPSSSSALTAPAPGPYQFTRSSAIPHDFDKLQHQAHDMMVDKFSSLPRRRPNRTPSLRLYGGGVGGSGASGQIGGVGVPIPAAVPIVPNSYQTSTPPSNDHNQFSTPPPASTADPNSSTSLGAAAAILPKKRNYENSNRYIDDMRMTQSVYVSPSPTHHQSDPDHQAQGNPSHSQGSGSSVIHPPGLSRTMSRPIPVVYPNHNRLHHPSTHDPTTAAEYSSSRSVGPSTVGGRRSQYRSQLQFGAQQQQPHHPRYQRGVSESSAGVTYPYTSHQVPNRRHTQAIASISGHSSSPNQRLLQYPADDMNHSHSPADDSSILMNGPPSSGLPHSNDVYTNRMYMDYKDINSRNGPSGPGGTAGGGGGGGGGGVGHKRNTTPITSSHVVRQPRAIRTPSKPGNHGAVSSQFSYNESTPLLTSDSHSQTPPTPSSLTGGAYYRGSSGSPTPTPPPVMPPASQSHDTSTASSMPQPPSRTSSQSAPALPGQVSGGERQDVPPTPVVSSSSSTTNSAPPPHPATSFSTSSTHEPHVIATARGFFDEKGGLLEDHNTGVSIEIPPGALPSNQPAQEIYFKVCQESDMAPPLDQNKGETLLSPLVMCGPQGTQFLKPIQLRLPHVPAVNPDSWSFSLKSAGDANQWYDLDVNATTAAGQNNNGAGVNGAGEAKTGDTYCKVTKDGPNQPPQQHIMCVPVTHF